ncbi:MAG TPA: CoA-acylating methylmalonate-semialdehyde dehydrogenase [Solirubrobacteraceae bacterium]|nr:CoA-acylating methylmalonate-semialdehyde dehydrogenase [Solirubrobacteraceae bacterium]
MTTATADTTKAPSDAPLLENYVDGAWRAATTADTLESRDPATGELIANVPLSNAQDVDAAVQAAKAALPQWRATPPAVRARAIMKLRESLAAHQDEIARLVTRDMGKTVDDAFMEVGRGIESVEAAIGIPHLLKGENLEGVARGVDVHMVRQPVGVVAAITPFNFPAMIPLWFLPYAIACGNTFILKPSEQDPTPSRRIIELVDAIEEIPKGVVNLVHGAHDAVNGLLDHPGVDAISFVGSAKTARYIATKSAENGKRVQALGGAKNSMVVMPDADPKLLTGGVMGSAFGAAGQRCLAGSIALLVGTKEEQDRSKELLVNAAKELKVGAGDDPHTDVCPVVSPQARERLVTDIENAANEGAEIVLDGREAGPGTGGAQLAPTILDNVAGDSYAAREELFGPVLSLVRVDTLDDAIEWTNESRYGNSAIIFTESGGAAREFRYGVGAGMIGVNVGVAAPVAWFPFAGWKDSIDGDLHANGTDAIEFYTRKKVVTERWA